MLNILIISINLSFALILFVNKMSNKQATQIQKSITQPILTGINKDFLGLGHVLEKKRKDRRLIQDQERMIENRVLYLMKESQKTNKSIQDKKKCLNQILQIRKRQQTQRQERERFNQMKQQQLQRLKQQSQQFRTKHKSTKHQSLSKLMQKNRNDFLQIKRKSEKAKMFYRQTMTDEQENKMMKFKSVQESKELGKYKIQEYLKNKNREHIREYQKRMNKEQDKMDRKLSLKQVLEKKQSQLLKTLQQSHQFQQQLKLNIQKAQQIQLKQLEKILMNKKLILKQIHDSGTYTNRSRIQKYNLHKFSPRKSLQSLGEHNQQYKKIAEKLEMNTIKAKLQTNQDPQSYDYSNKIILNSNKSNKNQKNTGS